MQQESLFNWRVQSPETVNTSKYKSTLIIFNLFAYSMSQNCLKKICRDYCLRCEMFVGGLATCIGGSVQFPTDVTSTQRYANALWMSLPLIGALFGEPGGDSFAGTFERNEQYI